MNRWRWSRSLLTVRNTVSICAPSNVMGRRPGIAWTPSTTRDRLSSTARSIAPRRAGASSSACLQNPARMSLGPGVVVRVRQTSKLLWCRAGAAAYGRTACRAARMVSLDSTSAPCSRASWRASVLFPLPLTPPIRTMVGRASGTVWTMFLTMLLACSMRHLYGNGDAATQVVRSASPGWRLFVVPSVGSGTRRFIRVTEQSKAGWTQHLRRSPPDRKRLCSRAPVTGTCAVRRVSPRAFEA